MYLFGSFARGAAEPHDIDVAIEMDRDDRWIAHAVQSLSSGRNPQSLIHRALVGNSRSFGFFFDGAARTDFPLTLLWRRGEAISIAAQRLHTLASDPTASRAPRDAMLPQFEGLDRWIDRPAREHLTSAVAANAISIERLDLPDATVTDPVAAEHLLDRWNPSSPLCRAGHAVLAYVEQRGHDSRAVHLHGKDVHHRRTPHFTGLSLRYFKPTHGA
ncbi:nucleotidyltransferase domain-containing protein [Dactylosporangium sp. NPDC049742]|uniref:nucleotidyltransferase domain-containing protein n=1 Tax=Dactylosporangium sp. NPDC049742 TaxID=3154737 RepID=UPI003443D2F2